MKTKFIFLPLVALCLCGCSKTDKLYKLRAYESPYFNSNYYLKNDTKDFVISREINESALELCADNSLKGIKEADRGGYVWKDQRNENMWGYHNNLGRVDEAFKKGAISKLYDGRVRCDGLQQKSRAQLDKVGYDAKFPLTMSDCDYFAFSCRGGTTLPEHTLKDKDKTNFKFNFKVGFFTKDNENSGQYIKHIYELNNLLIDTDNDSATDLVSFYVEKKENGKSVLEDTVAMSIEWECVDEALDEFNLTDDRLVKEKDHLAIMLYEVFLGNSTWYK